MTPLFLRAYPPAQPSQGPSFWFPFRNGKVLVQSDANGLALLRGGEELRELLQPATVLYLGTLEDHACLVCEVSPQFVLPAHWQELSQWDLFGRLDEQASILVGYAVQLLRWPQESKYCPVCAHLTEPSEGTWGRTCPDCGHISYPPVTPAVLVLVYDEDRLLLTHKPGWGKMYSCIAGFVEPGESLEDCVRREVKEEVGLEVTDVTYASSQPWPFPHQLMLGFTARYTGGNLSIDRLELDDAAWFHLDALPPLPMPQALAHQMITNWIASRQIRAKK